MNFLSKLSIRNQKLVVLFPLLFIILLFLYEKVLGDLESVHSIQIYSLLGSIFLVLVFYWQYERGASYLSESNNKSTFFQINALVTVGFWVLVLLITIVQFVNAPVIVSEVPEGMPEVEGKLREPGMIDYFFRLMTFHSLVTLFSNHRIIKGIMEKNDDWGNTEYLSSFYKPMRFASIITLSAIGILIISIFVSDISQLFG